jgi:NAD(P)-dependent dehydrogenase (short-subunit alcohol dehydrogenase family)
VFLGTKLAAEQMAKTGGGSIVNISSDHGICRQHQRPSGVSRLYHYVHLGITEPNSRAASR